MGNYQESLTYCDQALAIRKEKLGEQHAGTIQVRRERADILEKLGRKDDAAAERERADRLQKKPDAAAKQGESAPEFGAGAKDDEPIKSSPTDDASKRG